jgi:Flp pilus assembly protein TadD
MVKTKSRLTTGPASARVTLILASVLVLVTGALYWQVSGFEFLNFDDDLYVTKNLPMQRGWDAGVLWRAITTNLVGNWQPVTYLSHALDVQLFGLNPAGHHLVSALLHVVNAFLLLVLARSIGIGPVASAFVAGLFALHPQRIESVAWVAERKDVLCAFFFLLALLIYVRSGGAQKFRAYLLLVFLFCLGLLSKPMLVTMPGVLLLLDYWPLQRGPAPWSRRGGSPGGGFAVWRGLALQKIPLMVISVAFSIVAIFTQRGADAVRGLDAMPLAVRLQTALVAATGYLGKFFFPSDLSPFYTHPGKWPSWLVAGCGLLLLGLTVLFFLMREKRPWWLCGWLWYLGMLVPVIGIVQVGDQWMADRYTYLPLIGIAMAIGVEGERLASSSPLALWLSRAVGAFALVALGAASALQIPVWRNSETLSQRAITKDGGHWSMRTNHAISLAQNGKMTEAITEFEAIQRDFPADPESSNNLGFALLSSGRGADAVSHLSRAVALNPDNFSARINLGKALQSIGNSRAALSEFERVMHEDPDDPAAYLLAASIYATDLQLGQPAKAIELASGAISRTPHPNLQALEVLAIAHVQAGQLQKARAVFEQARQAALASGRVDLAARFDAEAATLTGKR